MSEYFERMEEIDKICEQDQVADAKMNVICDCVARIEDLENLLDGLGNLQSECQEWAADKNYAEGYGELLSAADAKLYLAQRKAEDELRYVKHKHNEAIKAMNEYLKANYNTYYSEVDYEWQL